MRYKLKIVSALIVPSLVGPVLAEGLTYKDYAKAPEVWRRGYISGIAAYMSAVPQPDEVPPYPVRAVLKGCLGKPSAPAISIFRGSIPHPCNRCVRFATTVASSPATLATKRTLLLTWAGLAPGWIAPGLPGAPTRSLAPFMRKAARRGAERLRFHREQARDGRPLSSWAWRQPVLII